MFLCINTYFLLTGFKLKCDKLYDSYTCYELITKKGLEKLTKFTNTKSTMLNVNRKKKNMI